MNAKIGAVAKRCGDCNKTLDHRNKSGFCRKCSPKNTRTGPNHWNWGGDGYGYVKIHRRVVRSYGYAREHPCVDCWGDAEDWSWVHGTDPANIMNYVPRCKKCHSMYDKARLGAKHTESTKQKMSENAKQRSRRANGQFERRSND